MTPDAPESRTVFAAYSASTRAVRTSWKTRVLILLGVLGLVGVAVWLVEGTARGGHTVVTRHGVRHLREGMTREEVLKLFGSPMGVHPREGSDCLRFGNPSIEAARILVYVVCFEDGRVAEVTPRRFDLTLVESAPAP